MALSRWVLGIGLLGGSLSLIAGFLSILPWVVCGPVAGGLLVSWFGGEVKKRLDKASEKHKEIKVIRFKQKAALRAERVGTESRRMGAKMGIVPRDRDRASDSQNHLLSRNGEEAKKTRT